MLNGDGRNRLLVVVVAHEAVLVLELEELLVLVVVRMSDMVGLAETVVSGAKVSRRLAC